MIKIMIPGESREYIDPVDEDTDNPTVWELRNLSIKEQVYIHAMLKDYTGNDLSKGLEIQVKILSIGLIGAKNFDGEFTRDESQKCLIDTIKPWCDKTLASIHPDLRNRISAQIVNPELLTEDERKN